MSRVIQYLNQIPFKCTLKQYFPRAEGTDPLDHIPIDSPELWDALRVDSPYFQVPTERDAWVDMCMSEDNKDGLDGHLPERASALADMLNDYGFSHVHSVGVGSGAFEYHLKKNNPTIHLTVSDYPPGIVDTLGRVFHECDDIRQFDILGPEWVKYSDKPELMVILNRLDPLFNNDQWTKVFTRMADAGVVHALYIPAWILTCKTFCNAMRRHSTMKLLKRPNVFTGWTRNRRVYESFWEKSYDAIEISLGDHQAFMLTLRSARLTT